MILAVPLLYWLQMWSYICLNVRIYIYIYIYMHISTIIYRHIQLYIYNYATRPPPSLPPKKINHFTAHITVICEVYDGLGFGANFEGYHDYMHLDVSKNRGTPKWMVYNGKPY